MTSILTHNPSENSLADLQHNLQHNLEHNFHIQGISQSIKPSRSTDVAVIAGNGPSLATMDYEYLPAEFDVFRCNQFYCESQYYLGKNIKYVFFNPHVMFEQWYTAAKLRANGDYNIEHIVCVTLPYLHREREGSNTGLPAIFPGLILSNEITDQDLLISQTLAFNELYENKRITAGVYMSLCAAILGYKKLFITGIDLYSGKSNYAFKTPDNLKTLLPIFAEAEEVNEGETEDNYSDQVEEGKGNYDTSSPQPAKPSVKEDVHDASYEIEILKLIQEHFQVEIYVLSQECPLSQVFPLASQAFAKKSSPDKPKLDFAGGIENSQAEQREQAEQGAQAELRVISDSELALIHCSKPENAITDIQIPPKEARERFEQHFINRATLPTIQAETQLNFEEIRSDLKYLKKSWFSRNIVYPIRDFLRRIRGKKS